MLGTLGAERVNVAEYRLQSIYVSGFKRSTASEKRRQSRHRPEWAVRLLCGSRKVLDQKLEAYEEPGYDSIRDF